MHQYGTVPCQRIFVKKFEIDLVLWPIVDCSDVLHIEDHPPQFANIDIGPRFGRRQQWRDIRWGWMGAFLAVGNQPVPNDFLNLQEKIKNVILAGVLMEFSGIPFGSDLSQRG